MTKYTFWYKKEIKAQDINIAIKKEKKTKMSFHSIKQEDEPDIIEKVSLIGFNYTPDEEE